MYKTDIYELAELSISYWRDRLPAGTATAVPSITTSLRSFGRVMRSGVSTKRDLLRLRDLSSRTLGPMPTEVVDAMVEQVGRMLSCYWFAYAGDATAEEVVRGFYLLHLRNSRDDRLAHLMAMIDNTYSDFKARPEIAPETKQKVRDLCDFAAHVARREAADNE